MARPKDLGRREEILKSILKVFRKHGGWDLSLNEIARQLNTSTRMLVHHFGTKENLINECKKTLETRLHKDLASAPPHKNWKSLVCQVWESSLQNSNRDDRRLSLISTLQNPRKSQSIKENERIIDSLRELLPSRLKKFAEDVFIYALGLDLYVLAGGNANKALRNLQSYLRRLEEKAA
ncbi:TetR/AcrR family transcriptional regulator [Bdellovibrio bacteriovorus]|uniref:TetR/AcrR family transcriptional regulator n=1 Tax=Bdellovibrio bacteriovorus TaxID=959 RepID=UPI0035A8722B